MGDPEEKISQFHIIKVKPFQPFGLNFVLYLINEMVNEKDETPQEKKGNHTNLPIKTTATDNIKNTAAQEGLNSGNTTSPNLEPGTSSNPDFTETD